MTANIPVKVHNFKPHKRGTTFPGASFNLKKNGAQLDLSGCTIIMALKTSKTTQVPSYTMSTTNGKILITDPSGKFDIVPQIINIAPGIYFYDILFIFPDGVSKVYVEGSMQIEQGITSV